MKAVLTAILETFPKYNKFRQVTNGLLGEGSAFLVLWCSHYTLVKTRNLTLLSLFF